MNNHEAAGFNLQRAAHILNEVENFFRRRHLEPGCALLPGGCRIGT
jgi:hypothetical protein